MIDLLTYALSKKSSGSNQQEIDLSGYATKTELNDYAKKDEIRAYIPF